MRIGVDGRSLVGESASALRQARGIARLVSSLLDAMVTRHPEHEWHVLVGAEDDVTVRGGAQLHVPRGPARLVNAAAAVTGRPRLDRRLGGPLDVVWLPAPAPVAVSRSVPYALTVHDLSTEVRRGDFGAYARLWGRLANPRRLARGAAEVIVDSTDTGEQVSARWGIADATLIQPGVWRPPAQPPEVLAGLRRRHGIPERYLLFVGALEPRKGLDVLVEAFAAARAQGLGAGLVLAGDGEQRERLQGTGPILTGRVSDHELAALYAGARATVLPSLLEGFGFTPLESLAAGTPAVVSELPSVRETLGEAGLFVPPGDADALADALIRIDADDALRGELVERGAGAVAALSWERAADRAVAVLERAAAA